MTRNRKAELQRKLAMAPVASPPTGLADRIKSEIPRDLHAEADPGAAARSSWSHNLRIAASIILLTSSLYFAIHLFSRAASNPGIAMKDERMTTPVARPQIVALPATPPQPGSGHPAQTTADQPSLPGSPPPRIVSALSSNRLEEKKREESDQMSTTAPALAGSIETPAFTPQEPVVVAGSATQSVPAAAEGGFAPERVDGGRATAKAVAASRGSAAPAAAVAEPAPPPARDAAPRNFVAIEEAISNGETPRYVDIAAIVHHFSAPERTASSLRVELEASSAPFDATKWLLRVSVDAPAQTVPEIALRFGDAVTAHRAVSGAPAPNETALYEIEIKATASPDQTIASVHAGEVERAIRVADLRQWNSATPRMKRASLAAAWARTLQSHAPAAAIVAKAREAHFDELADLAERAAQNR